jgi:hydroxymethylpyrimidine pyrophosphatase-like HAD family hydrolase
VLLVAVLRVIRDANPGQQVVRIGGAMMRETPDLHTGTAPMGLHADCGRCGESTWPTGGPLAPIDLLFSAAEIEEQLRLAIRERQWLDAYLLAAGLNQMVEDRLHPDPLQLRRAAGYLRGRGSRAARFGGRMSGAAAGLLRPFAVGSRSASLWRGRESLTEATIRLAGAVLDPEGVDPVIPAGLDTLQATVRALGADVVRVSTCFRSFDQHPDDIRELVSRFVRSHHMSTLLCVVGVRTSGSYLAPLCAGALRAAGVKSVAVLTYRPGRPLRRAEAKTVREVVAAGGKVLLTDDPPVSGTALAETAHAISGLGVPDTAIVPLLALSDTEVPKPLARWSGVFLRWDEWSVHERLTEVAVSETLAALLGPGHGVVASRQPWPARGYQRGRAGARFSVQVTRTDGPTRRSEIAVEGAGLGYLGRHAIAVASALPGYCPQVYGLADGLLYREWIPGALAAPDAAELALAVTDYVVARGRAMRVGADPTLRLRGREPVWEVAASLLSALFGRLAPAGQAVLLDPIVQRLLRVDNPSVPDGQTHVRYWRATRPGSPLRKVNFHQGAFSNLEYTCYDAVFDLAGAAADPPSDDFESVLRATYRHHTGVTIEPERWLLYRLTHLRRLRRAGEMEPHHAADRSADAVHDYLSTIFAAGESEEDGGDNGKICAIDLDGVLETDPLGFPCVTPSGALALRALSAHGFRPILATGRSLPDTVARCRRFGLAGAVAEYGAVLYDHSTGHHTDMRDGAARATMEQVRLALARHGDIEVDERHHYIVRTRSGSGPMPEDLAREIGSSAGGLLRIVHGEGQTDFVPVGVDKGTGLRALAAQLRGRVVLAVGDSTEDVAMFAEAALARAPRNANRQVRSAGIQVTRGAYQAGLADACSELLGHPPGGCSRCRPQELSGRSAILCAVLGLREDGLRGFPSRTARLAALAARTSRW